MGIDILVLMKQEWSVILILFTLLFIKVGTRSHANEFMANLVSLLLLLNFIAGLFGYREGILFNEMYKTNHLIVAEKNILSLYYRITILLLAEKQ
jgi:NADH-quinone oxidoreductase subunit N